jgi:hypothetical protein
VKVWDFAMPRPLPIVVGVTQTLDDTTQFLYHFSPMCNRDYTKTERAKQIKGVLMHVETESAAATLDELKKGMFVIVGGNPYDSADLPKGITAADLSLEFTMARVMENVAATADHDLQVQVLWYRCNGANPNNTWNKVFTSSNAPWISSTSRGSILLRNIKVNTVKRLDGGTIKVKFI